MLFTRKWGTYCTPILPMFPYGNINVRIPINILPFIFFHHFSSHQAVLLFYITIMLKIGQFQLLFIPPGGKTCVSRMLVKFDHVSDITRPGKPYGPIKKPMISIARTY